MTISPRWRWFSAAICGFVFFCLTLYQSYGVYLTPGTHQWAWDSTLKTMDSIQTELESCRALQGEYPSSLAGLNVRQTDAWGWPWSYRRVGDAYELRSLGRDGQLGGDLWASDFGPGTPLSQIPKPTFREYFTTKMPRHFLIASGLAGIFAAGLMLFASRTPAHRQFTLRDLLFALGATIFVSFMVGNHMLMLHIPNGH